MAISMVCSYLTFGDVRYMVDLLFVLLVWRIAFPPEGSASSGIILIRPCQTRPLPNIETACCKAVLPLGATFRLIRPPRPMPSQYQFAHMQNHEQTMTKPGL